MLRELSTFKIIIFGDAGYGKTTFTKVFLIDLFKSDSKMTIGVDFEVKDLEVDGKSSIELIRFYKIRLELVGLDSLYNLL